MIKARKRLSGPRQALSQSSCAQTRDALDVALSSRMPEQDAPVLAAMMGLSAQYPCFGYRHIQVLLHPTSQRVTTISPFCGAPIGVVLKRVSDER